MMTALLVLLLAQPPAATPPGSPPPTPAHELLQIRRVYLLPMANGLDQYLAAQITRQGLLQVVADPAKADAILTDHLGKSFESDLAELYPEPKPPAAAKEPEQDTEDASKSTTLDVKTSPLQRPPSARRGKGTVFLVDRGSRAVLWSVYARPKRTMPDALNAVARDVAGQLASAIRRASKPSR